MSPLAMSFFPAVGDFGSDCVAFMPGDGLVDSLVGSAASRLVVVVDAPAAGGALCCTVEPGEAPPSRPVPVPCALAKLVPAISAATATESMKRLVIEFLLTCLHYPRRQRSEG